MKKTILSFLFAALGFMAMAQDKDFVKLDLAYQAKKYEDAKKELDKVSADPKAKDKPQISLYEAAIYSQFFADSTLAAKYPDAGNHAYAAFNTYLQKDPSLKILKETNILNSISWLYSSSFNNGKKFFTQSKWPESFENFKRATELSEFINKNGFNTNKSAIDTFTVLYTGYAAQNAGKPEDAVVYYEKLADLKVAGADMQPMYQYMLDDYAKMKQTDKFAKYLTLAKELYPGQATVWSQMEMNNMSQNSSMDQIIAKFKQESAGDLSEDQLITYAETFASSDKEQLKGMDSAAQMKLKLVAADAYAKAFAKNPTKGIYAFNAGVLNYNAFSILDERYYNMRGESPALKAARADIQTQQSPYADSAIIWLEKGYDVLKAKTTREKQESNSLNRSVDYLANLYMWKRDRTKGTAAAKDYDKYDAKFKQFDDEHDKYKQ